MKRYALSMFAIITMLTSQIEAESIVSEFFTYRHQQKEKDKITSKILSELLTALEMEEYIINNKLTSIESNSVHCTGEKGIGDSREEIEIRYFTNTTNPYVSLQDWLERSGYLVDKVKQFKKTVDIVNETDKDILFNSSVINLQNNGKTHFESTERVIFNNGRIYVTGHTKPFGKYTPQEKEKWIKRLENISYLNNLPESEIQAKKEMAESSQNRRKKFGR